jgi:hypothetical protein
VALVLVEEWNGWSVADLLGLVVLRLTLCTARRWCWCWRERR